MGKVIAVWGSAGAGKSTVAGLIARYYAERKKKTIVMSFDVSTPMMPVWLPNENVTQSESLGAAFTEKAASADIIMKRIHPYKPEPNIGFLAYTAEDNCYSYNFDYKNICDAIRLAKDNCDILVLDCATSFTDITVPACIELADKSVCVLKPDLASASYFRSNSSLMATAAKFRLNEHIKVFNQVKPFHAVEEMNEAVGRVSFCFRYNPDIENAMLCGDAVNTLQYCRDSKEYKGFFKSLEKIAGVTDNVGEE